MRKPDTNQPSTKLPSIPREPASRCARDRGERFRRLLSRVAGGLLGWTRERPPAAPQPSARSREDWLAIPDAVACPVCGAVYVGESPPGEDPGVHEDQGWEAIDRLAAECPNHDDFFIVGV